MELIRMELRTTTTKTTTAATRNGDSNTNGEVMMEANNNTRKIYAVMGHGIPRGLLCHLVEVARDWLSYHHHPSDDTQSDEQANESTTSQTTNQQSSDNVKLAFTNTLNSTLLHQHTIRTTNTHGVTTTLPSLPNEWDRDFEMYMVMMDRMASRMASLAIPSPSDGMENNVDDATLGTGSIVTPSQLTRWDVTITKKETLPTRSLLLPGINPLLAGGQGGGSNNRSRRVKGTMARRHEPILTLEWVKKENNKFSNIVLRLQDDDDTENNLQDGSRDPITLVFDGEYVAP